MQKLYNTKHKINILIFGKHGQVAWELRRTLCTFANIISVDRNDVDLTNEKAICDIISSFSPDIIINAAAYTSVDKAEKEFYLAKKINSDAPAIMAREAKKINCILIHYSTDYVYDGTKKSPYTETDTTNPLGAYGLTKYLGDESIKQSDCNHLIFRTSWVYGCRGNNFMLTMKKLALKKEKLRVVSDQIGCPTWSRLIAEVTSHAIYKIKLFDNINNIKGVYHLCSSGQTTWFHFAKAIIDLIPDKKCIEIEPITTGEYPTPTLRSRYSVMSCQKLENVFGMSIPDWYDGLCQVLEK